MPSLRRNSFSRGDEMGSYETRFRVRFHEVDAYGMVWHGHFVAWFEMGRNELTEKFGLGPFQLKGRGLLAPVVHLSCEFKQPARFGETLLLQTSMERTEVAKLIFHYRILHQGEEKTVATGSTTHVLTDLNGNLLYRIPPDLLEKIEEMMKFLGV